MADGYSMGAGDLFRSRILGSGMEDTPYNQGQIGQLLGGIQPEQLAAFFQNPQVQRQFQQFGIDPQAMLGGMRQSPFFPNSFMQHHPMLGGGLTHAMANVAMTPEAPLVSGAGSGMSRAMQGLMGGNDMLRQYQLHQMMAPMGALGSMMPMYGEQRRRGIEEAIIAQEQRRPQEFQEAQITRREPRINQVPGGYTSTQYQDPQAQGQPQPQQGGMPGIPGTQGLVSPMAPGTPAQPGGWQEQFHATDPDLQAKLTKAQHPERVAKAGETTAETQAGLPGAKVDELKSRADKNRSSADKTRRGPQANPAALAKQYNDIKRQYDAMDAEIEKRHKLSPTDPKYGHLALDDTAYKAEKAKILQAREESKANIDQAQGRPGASSGLVSPNAPIQTPGGPEANAPQKKGKGGGKQQQLMKDEEGHVWDISSGKPVLVQQAQPRQ